MTANTRETKQPPAHPQQAIAEQDSADQPLKMKVSRTPFHRQGPELPCVSFFF